MGALPTKSRGRIQNFRLLFLIDMKYISDISQPSLGTDNEQLDRLATPPLSPMYSCDGQSIQVSVSSKGGKTQAVYTKPITTTSMETHWEEAIQCNYPEKKFDKNRKLIDVNIDGDDTESELITIPESDPSDSTLHGSIQDSLEEGVDDTYCHLHQLEKSYTVIKLNKQHEIIQKPPREVYVNRIAESSHMKPMWIIGSEDDCLKSWENNAYSIQDATRSENGNSQQRDTVYSKNCSWSSANTSVITAAVSLTKTMASGSRQQSSHATSDMKQVNKSSPLLKQKKITESSIVSMETSILDCEECIRAQNRSLPAPIIERLLPIGAARSPSKCCHI